MIRAVTGLLAVGLAFAVVALLNPTPQPLNERTPLSTAVTAADLPVGCPGWLQLPVGDAGDGQGGVAPGAGEVLRTVLVSGGGQADQIGAAFASDADEAVEVERVGVGDLAGLAAATCARPREDSWLVGGSTQLGSSARLVLVNPTGLTTDVVATIFGPTGQIAQPIIVSMGARSVESVLLEGVAAELATLVVHVKASGVGVVAAIQDSRLDGFIPAGSDWITAGAEPGTTVVLPGVGPSDPDGDGGPASVRLMAPDGATVSLSLVSVDGSQPWPGVGSIRLGAGVPVDVDVPASAMATVIVHSDRPVVAAAISSVARPAEEGLEGSIARDFAWVVGQDPTSGTSLSLVVPPYRVTAVVYSGSGGTFRLVDPRTGAVLTQKAVGGGTTTEIPVDIQPGTTVVADGNVTWVLRVADDPGFVTAVQPVDVHVYPTTVVVVPAPYVP